MYCNNLVSTTWLLPSGRESRGHKNACSQVSPLVQAVQAPVDLCVSCLWNMNLFEYMTEVEI